MPIEKSLAPAPMGLAAASPEDEIEIEVVLEPDEGEEELRPENDSDDEFNENLVDILDEGELQQLAGDLIGDYDDDVTSRADWLRTYADGLELLGVKVEERSEPWEGACGVTHPLLTEAVVKFQAETIQETFPAQGPVKTQIIGKETPEKRDASIRVRDDMNYQLTERMVEYRPEHERMLWGLGLAGNAFKKVYFDPSLGRQVSIYVPAEDVVVPYGASNLESAERVTHVMRKTKNELKKLQKSGFYADIELDNPTNTLDEVEKKIAAQLGFRAETDDRYKLLEIQVDAIIEADRFRDADDEGIALPYIVTLEKGTQAILSIRRNWRKEDEKKEKRNHFVHYSYIPAFGFYAFGLIHLIGAFSKSGTSLIRQLVDAGTLSNLPGGFKTKGLRVKGDDTPIGPGEFRDVDVASGTMRDNIMPLPYKEPSATLYQLLQTITDEGRRLASISDMKISDMSAQTPVGTTLAILERTLKLMSAVQARIHYSMKQEFKLLKNLIRDFTDDDYSYEPEEGSPRAKQADYDSVDVIPVSDPNAATMAQKIVQYQAVFQLAQSAPQIYDMPFLHRQMLEVLGIKNAQKLVPLKDDDDMKPRDPVSENMDVINGKPVKAFIAQDHQAHIAVHISAMQDPKIMQLLQQNPNAEAMAGAMAAHISEHLAFEYRRQIEEQAGVPLPAPDAPLSPEMEIAISRLQAAAAQQLLGKHQGEAAQEQAQQMAQDPIMRMQMEELQIKKTEAETKGKKLLIDAATQADKLDIERERIAAQKEIAGLNAGVKVASEKAKLSAEQMRDGMQMGIDIMSQHAEHAQRDQDRQMNKDQQNAQHMQAGHQAAEDRSRWEAEQQEDRSRYEEGKIDERQARAEQRLDTKTAREEDRSDRAEERKMKAREKPKPKGD